MKNAVVFCITLEDTVQLEAYWDSSYVIPLNRGCGEGPGGMGEGLYDAIDLWRDVPKGLKDMAKPAGLVINVAYADHDVDR